MRFHRWTLFISVVAVLISFNTQAQVVAIIDTGINRDVTLRVPTSKLEPQRCLSETDLRQASSPGAFPNYSYTKASMCPNGSLIDNTSNSAFHPRNLYIGFHIPQFNTADIGEPLTHGNELSNALYSFNTTVKHKHIQTFALMDNQYIPSVGLYCRHGLVAFRDTLECYSPNDYFGNGNRIQKALRSLADNDTSRISAVAIATTITPSNGGNLPTPCRDELGQAEVDRLYAKGIAVVTALDNKDYPSAKLSWPNCLDKVINVAFANQNGLGGVGVGANGIDYYALGTSTGASGSVIGNSYSAPRVAGAFALLHSANPQSSVQQKITALNQASSLTYNYKGFNRRFIKTQHMTKAIEIIQSNSPTNPNPNPEPPTTIPPKPPTPLGQTARLGITDNTVYSHRDYPNDPNRAVRLAFTLNGGASASLSEQKNELSVASASNPNISISDLRDIRLDFDGEFFSYADVRYVDGIDIWVNGVQRINFNSTQQAPTSNLHFKKHSFMLNRNWLQSGSNEIQIKPRKWSQIAWRVSRIRMDYNSPIPMVIGSSDTKLYGHRVGTKRHLTGLRVEFASVKSDVEFSAKGFDIDSNTEIAVFFNRRRIGYLSRGSSSQYNSGNSFLLEKESFVPSGINTIEFVQTSSSDRENWGVVNMELTGVKPPAIQGALMLLLGDVE